MALFGEKYGDSVRVVSVGDWARELCGGTHTARSGQLGVVKFLSEASIGSGVRRIEALVGADAYRFLAREHILVSNLAQMVKARPEELTDRIGGLLDRLKEAEATIAKMRKVAVMANIEGTIGTRYDIGGARVWTYSLPDGSTGADLREATNAALQMVATDIPVVLVGAAVDAGKVSLLVTVNADRAEGRPERPGHPGRGAAGRGRPRRRQGRHRAGRRIQARGRRGRAAGRPRVPGGPRIVRPGVRIGIDVGSVRIGVARTDPSGAAGRPGRDRGPRRRATSRGSPSSSSSTRRSRSSSGCRCRCRAGPARRPRWRGSSPRQLVPVVAPVPVRLVDERLSTVSATRDLRAAGRSSRTSRAVVDQAAAVVIVQYAVDSERATGVAPGTLVQE